MPRHPPNALTSRLRIHTTNDSAGTARKLTHGHRDDTDDYLSSIVVNDMRADPKIVHDTATASILRTHSQCQNAQSLRVSAQGRTSGLHHLEYRRALRSDARWWSLSGSNR
jgi:hypothetical protein